LPNIAADKAVKILYYSTIGETMDQDKNNINCPKCHAEIDVKDILYRQVNEQLKKQYHDKFAESEEKHDSQSSLLAEERKTFEADKIKQKDEIAKQVNNEVKKNEIILKKRIREEVEEEKSDADKLLQEDLDQKSNQIKKLNKDSIELEKVKREKAEQKATITSTLEKEHSKNLIEVKDKAQKEEREKSELKFKEFEKRIEDQTKLTEEMARKQEQGSMQTQGEVQELAIEEWLAENFPLDVIQEIKKGERGADCLQMVQTRDRQNCGSIYYESKRTKSFQVNWIEKFKSDIREKNANIGVLVTEVMPSDMDRLGQRNGVWVCSFEEFKGLSTVLRESLIMRNSAIISQENKGEKMGMLYDFLTSNEFKLQVEAIVEGFTQMKSDLESEKRSMQGIWKKREKQIDKVLLNTTHMHGSIKGIAGKAVPSVPLLELSSDEDEDLDLLI
jgi:hypothetical protein